jgi:hypothetical protein
MELSAPVGYGHHDSVNVAVVVGQRALDVMAAKHHGYGLKQEATRALTWPGLGRVLRVVGGWLGMGLMVAWLWHGEAGARQGGAALRMVVVVWGYLGVSRWWREWEERVAAVARPWPATIGGCRGNKGGRWSEGQLWRGGATAMAD